jgi:hypothetical protein
MEETNQEVKTMLESVFERVKGMILKPGENFRLAANDAISFTLVYYFILLAVFGILFSFSLSSFGLLMLYSPNSIIAIVTMLGQMIVSLFLGAAWLHVWVYISGGRQGIKNTLKVVAYSMTPTLLLGWLVPVGMIVGFVWYLVLEVLGVRELQQLSTRRAILAVALPLIVGLIIIVIVMILTNPDFLPGLMGNAASSRSQSYHSSYNS